MKHILTLLFLLFALQLWGCSEDAVNQTKTEIKEAEPSEQKAETVEDHSELYYMHGIQISHRLCYAADCESDILASDTLKTSFLVWVTFSSENPDSVLFDGLEGVNTGPREMIPDGFNGGAAAYPECISPSSDCGHAKKTGTDLEFLVSSPGGYYWGTGTLDNDKLIIEAKYVYRGSGADYFLEGHKIVEEK